MKLGDPLDAAQYEIRNSVVHNLASAPSSPKAGQIYYLTGSNIPYVFNGSQGRPLDAAALSDGSIQIAALATNPLLRSNQSGSQPSSTISDLKSTVTGYTFDLFAAPVATVNFGSQRVSNIAQASNSTDAVRLDQMQTYVAAAVQGQTSIKNPVKVYAASNITLSGTQTIDGVALSIGDSVAAGGQTTATQNNIYVVASGPWTARSDTASGGQWAEGTEFLVTEGSTYAGAIFRQTTSGTITLGTTALAFTQGAKINQYTADGTTLTLTGMAFSVHYGYGLTTTTGALGVDTTIFGRKYSATITTDGTNSVFTVTHGLATTDVIVGVRDSTGTKVFIDDNPANSSAVSISFGSVPTAGQTYRVTVMG